MNKILGLADALEAAGVYVTVMPDAEVPHKSGSYKWREPGEEPAGHMAHHTATPSYTPNRDKANGYMGMGDPTESNPRLHQATAPGRIPIYTIANFVPGPITSGSGRRDVLDNFVKLDIPYVGKQTLPDDSNGWAGNTHYWNTENVLDGIGTAMPGPMWDTYVVVCRVLNDLMGWTSARIIGHGQHTKRKPDLFDGRFDDMAMTINALRAAVDDTITPPTGDKVYLPITTESVGRDSDIQWLQRALNRAGGTGTPLTIDGVYGPATVDAVKDYQNGDGTVYGPKTHDKLLAVAYGG